MKKKELISYLRGICKYYGITAKFSSKKHSGGIGFYDVDKNEIEVYTKLVNAKIACVTMHEIAHALNVRDHK